MTESDRLLILYGSQTFTAQELAERIWRMTKALGFRGPVLAMDEYPISKLIHEEFVIFVCATTGQGDEPDNMKKFWKFLLRRNLPTNSLAKLKYGVLGLGDSSYLKFNFVGKKLHKRLMQLGGTPLVDVGLCDYQHDLGHDAVMQPWLTSFYACLKQYFPQINTDIKADFVPRWKVSLVKCEQDIQISADIESSSDIYYDDVHDEHCVNDVKLFEVEKNVRTTDERHFQDVRLITLKTKEDNLDYISGDVFNIRPRNSKEDIDDLFGIFNTHNLDIKPNYRLLVEECHADMPVPPFLQKTLTLYQIAEQYWDLRAYPTQYVFSLLSLVSKDKLERDKCIELSSPEGQEDWLNYSRRPKRTILEVLHDFHKSTSKLTIQVLFELFSTIKPRSFSIASGCLPYDGRVEMLVAVVSYKTKLMKPRLGLCSNWLKGLNQGDKVYGWIKPGTIRFPDDHNTPLILIGPGTGLAPFRSLLQNRLHTNKASANTLHLFFGCRYKDKDFHCKEELEKMVEERKLTMYCAFSRDQDDKIYVQHKITEHGGTIWRLINERNAFIYICGNSKNMPDNVKEALTNVVRDKGGLSAEDSDDLMKSLENSGRLQVETW